MHRRNAPVRFVLTLSIVCNRGFESLGLEKHPKVRPVPVHKVAPALLGNEVRIDASAALSLVNLSMVFHKLRPVGR